MARRTGKIRGPSASSLASVCRPPEWKLIGVREYQSMTMIEAGQRPFGSNIADVLRDIGFREGRTDIRGIINRFGPGVICIEGQTACSGVFRS